MPPRLPRITARELTRVLRRHGFELVSQRGNHQKWRNDSTGRQVIVPFHKGKRLPLGTPKSIIEGSGIPVERFR